LVPALLRSVARLTWVPVPDDSPELQDQDRAALAASLTEPDVPLVSPTPAPAPTTGKTLAYRAAECIVLPVDQVIGRLIPRIVIRGLPPEAEGVDSPRPGRVLVVDVVPPGSELKPVYWLNRDEPLPELVPARAIGGSRAIAPSEPQP
jgi:hypothetical protein